MDQSRRCVVSKIIPLYPGSAKKEHKKCGWKIAERSTIPIVLGQTCPKPQFFPRPQTHKDTFKQNWDPPKMPIDTSSRKRDLALRCFNYLIRVAYERMGLDFQRYGDEIWEYAQSLQIMPLEVLLNFAIKIMYNPEKAMLVLGEIRLRVDDPTYRIKLGETIAKRP
jgi:hypothetical protein